MAFLDNSGDIILDAVLTDTGRYRLAKGDGSFRISKFSFGDDEIQYNLYNYSHASGSAYYDLSILQSPIFEAFTNNTSVMKSHLISIPQNNLLYLPILKINELAAGNKRHTQGAFYVLCDEDTETAFQASNITQGIINGESIGGQIIRIDQGLDTTEISYKFSLDPELRESQYIIEMDNRFGKIASKSTQKLASISYLDDDNVASYYLSEGTDPDYVKDNGNTSNSTNETISGPRGTILEFQIASSLDLRTSTYLFNQLGTTGTAGNNAAFGIAATYTVDYIDTYIRITGATTGYVIDIPIRYVRVQ